MEIGTFKLSKYLRRTFFYAENQEKSLEQYLRKREDLNYLPYQDAQITSVNVPDNGHIANNIVVLRMKLTFEKAFLHDRHRGYHNLSQHLHQHFDFVSM